MTTPPKRPEHAQPSNTAVRKAGSTVRKVLRDTSTVTAEDDEALAGALATIAAYRSQFGEPMSRVGYRLRRIRDDERIEARVSSRLKRLPTIIDKLKRPNNTDLSRLEDIGGCRVVTDSYTDLRRIQDLVREHYGDNVHRERDYISEPRHSGYRSMHMIVVEGQLKIEIQLRTGLMHDWAQLVEAFSDLFVDNFKNDGSHPVQEFMKLQSLEGAHAEGFGPAPSEEELDKIRKLGKDVRQLLQSMDAASERNQ